MVVTVLTLGVAVVGCGKSDRDRYFEAMSQVLTDKDEIAKETKRFDESSAEEQCKWADHAELFALLKKIDPTKSMREIKKAVERAFENQAPEQRKEILKRYRKQADAL